MKTKIFTVCASLLMISSAWATQPENIEKRETAFIDNVSESDLESKSTLLKIQTLKSNLLLKFSNECKEAGMFFEVSDALSANIPFDHRQQEAAELSYIIRIHVFGACVPID